MERETVALEAYLTSVNHMILLMELEFPIIQINIATTFHINFLKILIEIVRITPEK